MLKVAGWISQAGMQSTRSLTVIAIFTSLIIASDFALAPALNVKMMDTIVFATAFVFGFRVGASVAVVSELIWSVVTPYGMFLPITPFLVGGELLFATAGYIASKIWGMERLSPLSSRSFFFGAILAICAFIWDFETNVATAIIQYGSRSLEQILLVVAGGIYFMIPHELSDFVLGTALAPIIIMYCKRMVGAPQVTQKLTVVQKEAA
jgi:uncharacterized membrane protein